MRQSVPRASVCGFSFCRNVTRLAYPVEAAVRSVLPLCDRFIVAVGRSEDDTRSRIEKIDRKVEIIDTVWPDVKTGGAVLAIEANKAMAAAEATGCTWGVYIQADEVVHEDDLPRIRVAMDQWANRLEVKALLFRYLHFYLDYQTINPWAYHNASRVVRLDGTCHIVLDGCGPAIKDYHGPRRGPARLGGYGFLDKHHLGGHVRWPKDPSRGPFAPVARIFHYGAVKTPEQRQAKIKVIEELWWGTIPEAERALISQQRFPDLWRHYQVMKRFRGTHPAVMHEWIALFPPFARARNRWLHPAFYLEILKHGFKG